jgi:hypothetical protein
VLQPALWVTRRGLKHRATPSHVCQSDRRAPKGCAAPAWRRKPSDLRLPRRRPRHSARSPDKLDFQGRAGDRVLDGNAKSCVGPRHDWGQKCTPSFFAVVFSSPACPPGERNALTTNNTVGQKMTHPRTLALVCTVVIATVAVVMVTVPPYRTYAPEGVVRSVISEAILPTDARPEIEWTDGARKLWQSHPAEIRFY